MKAVVKFVGGACIGVAVAMVGVPVAVMLAIALEIPLPAKLVALVGYWTHFLIYTGVLHVVLVPLILLVVLGLPVYVLVRIARAAWRASAPQPPALPPSAPIGFTKGDA